MAFAKESTTTTGTGIVSLGGAMEHCDTFVNVFGSGNVCLYTIVDTTGTNWEFGKGTVTAGSPATLSRTKAYSSSNNNALVNFAAGTKCVFAYSGTDLLSSMNIALKTGAFAADSAGGGVSVVEKGKFDSQNTTGGFVNQIIYTVNSANVQATSTIIVSITRNANSTVGGIVQTYVAGAENIVAGVSFDIRIIRRNGTAIANNEGMTVNYIIL